MKTSLAAAAYRAESWQMMSTMLHRLGRPNEAELALPVVEANDVHLRARGSAPL
ncbi:MAG: hypothetical protein ABIU29_06105 [Chthoniobacterales bacterium]